MCVCVFGHAEDSEKTAQEDPAAHEPKKGDKGSKSDKEHKLVGVWFLCRKGD